MGMSSRNGGQGLAWSGPFLAVSALALNLAGGIALKYFQLATKRPPLVASFVVLLIIIYLLRTVTWLAIGRVYQLSYIYPVLSINYALAFAAGLVLFGEDFSWPRLLGSLLVGCGVLVHASSPNRAEPIAPVAGR